jgi:hypothetical protein
MRPIYRSIRVILFAGLVVGCSIDSRMPTAPADAPSSVAPSVSPGGFVTPVPPGAGEGWTGIDWRELSSDDPLSHVRSMTRWSGGYMAVGDAEATGGLAHTPVWTSVDGAIWDLLGADVFGSATIVAGVGETADGLVALTVQGRTNMCKDEYMGDVRGVPCWSVTGPLQAWTSSDARNWTAHRGPNIAMPEEMGVYPTLQAGTADHLLVVTLKAQPLAISRDGITWEPVPAEAFTADWQAVDTRATPSGFFTVGASAGRIVALSSKDGRVWASHVMEPPAAGFARVLSRLVGGSAGLIATGEEYQLPSEEGMTGSAQSVSVWWSSLDGQAWDVLPEYPPLGAQLGADAQECFDACPDGSLFGDGERLLAYRSDGEQAGWTSFDGRSWQPLTFEGSRPATEAGQDLSSVVVLPIGVVLYGMDGSAWFGTPIS